jgi:hypothetical protein
MLLACTTIFLSICFSKPFSFSFLSKLDIH